jgi:hypothetical protein
MAKAAKRKAPSRVRYELGHPTVSCRVLREVYDRLQVVKKAEDKSFADVLKIGLGILEVRVKEEEEVREQGYAEGYRKGYADAERLYKVTYPCSVCRKMLTVTSGDEKEAIKQYMQEARWGHRACFEKKC